MAGTARMPAQPKQPNGFLQRSFVAGDTNELQIMRRIPAEYCSNCIEAARTEEFEGVGINPATARRAAPLNARPQGQ
jgi:hypothetical protein